MSFVILRKKLQKNHKCQIIKIMYKKKEKKEDKVKIVYKEKIVEVIKEVDGVIKTDLGFDVIHNGKIEMSYAGANSFRVAVKDYKVLLGV